MGSGHSHKRMSCEKQTLEDALCDLWTAGCSDLSSISGDDCRRTQDQAFRLRRTGVQVPQIFYWLRRGRDERAMTAAVDRLLAQLS